MGASNQLIRLTSVSYGDGLSSMNIIGDPAVTARIVFDQDGDMPNSAGLSDLFVSWGQFVDHDLSLTPDASGEHVFVPGLVAPFERSQFDTSTGTTTPREHMNVVDPSMNASMVYGSDDVREAELRTFDSGLLKMASDGMMELTDTGMAGASATKNLYLAGDVRANENTGLTTLHNLFSMEHNHWAKKIAAIHTSWDDEQIFQAARSIVEYEIQDITYSTWLPHLIGDAVGSYQGFDASVDGSIATEFSTAAFRFGHTMVSPTIKQTNEDGSTSAQGHIRVQDAFFNITQLQAHGIDYVLRGMTGSRAQESDAVVIDDLNFFLESPAGIKGFSLPALNILRGKDHGLGTYVEVRAELLGDIDPATLDPNDFSIITSDATVQAKLADVYASVLEVDVWVGGLAEDDIAGTQLGPLFTNIVADQFARTRAADDSFAQLDANLDPSLVLEVMGSSLGDIVTRNTGVTYTQEDVFVAANRMGGDDGSDYIKGTVENDLILGFAGRDYLKGNDGDDAIYGGDANDSLFGNAGEDALYGGDGRDNIFGGRDDDTLDGGAHNDRLFGGSGDDVLHGGEGDDRMLGGQGDDMFIFTAGDGEDRIRDFGWGDDVIELSGFGFTDFSDVMDIARQTWIGVVLDFDNGSHSGSGMKSWWFNWHNNDDGDVLTLTGVRLHELSAEDFTFG